MAWPCQDDYLRYINPQRPHPWDTPPRIAQPPLYALIAGTPPLLQTGCAPPVGEAVPNRYEANLLHGKAGCGGDHAGLMQYRARFACWPLSVT
jgi:hypothetical protein